MRLFREVICLEVRINKEVRDYQESIFFGLSMRQFLFSALAVLVALAAYYVLHRFVGEHDIGWICILSAFPFALCGFFQYNGMTAERFLVAVIRTELRWPKKLVFRSENLYADALKDSACKEVLKLD